MSLKKTIGITTGDPKGIGPQITAQALEDPEIQSLASFKIFGPLEVAKNLSDKEAAHIALNSIQSALQSALAKEIEALVTAPINKARLRLADPAFVDHTEFFASRCSAKVCPLFVARQWRVALVTRHLPLKEVAVKLNAMDILQAIRLTHECLQKYFKILEPRLAAAGLNPHAGESSLLGDEETRIILPAILQARKDGILIDGPLSPDTLFWQMTRGKWDAVIAMYHDQGLIPIKTLAFRDCVQMTLGLPFLRVSVDHGTAEDLVDKTQADPTNLKTAIRFACQ